MNQYQDKNIALVCNPLAGSGRSVGLSHSLCSLLNKLKISFRLFNGQWPADFDGYTDVWIIGGDGTLNYFINHYPSIQKPLSIFKGGSGNDFHWLLYGGMTMQQQVQQVLSSFPVPIDAGKCNEIIFMNGVGIGFDGKVVKDLLGKRKKAGKLSYYTSIIKNIFGYKESRYAIESEELQIAEYCLLVSIANGKRYGGGFQVAPKADVRDGLLDLNILKQLPVMKRLRYLPVIEKGKHLALPFVLHSTTKKVLIRCEEPVQAHVDGEFIEANQFEIEILPARYLFCF